MTDVIVEQPPPLVRVPNVELIQAGTWPLKSGDTTFTVGDLTSAVAALECPAVRRPVLKLAHDGNHGQPNEACLGYIDGMRLADNGLTLVGDYAGMPKWLAQADDNGDSVLASALPDRSVEGEFDFRCGLGHTHPFVVHAVSLLGEHMPGVSTLASLQDIATAYGVPVAAALNPELPAETGTRVVVIASEQETPNMPNPKPIQVTATVTGTDVQRAFYASALGESWDHWIVQIELDPLGVIYQDDASGSYFWAAATIGSGDGSEAVSFGDPEERTMQFVPKQTAASSGASSSTIVFASHDEQRAVRPGRPPTTTTAQNPDAVPAPGDHTGKGSAVAFSDEQLTTLRKDLGLPEDADEATITAAVTEALTERADPPEAPEAPATPVLPDGVVAVEESVLEELKVAAGAGKAARDRQLTEDRDAAIEAAIRAGKTTPNRRDHWIAAWGRDPEGTAQHLEQLAPGLVPVEANGGAGSPDPTEDDEYFRLFPDERPVKAGV